VAYTQARKTKTMGTRYAGFYLDADGKLKAAGTFASDEEALSVAQRQEAHVRGRRTGTSPAEKATMTIEKFAKTRFLPRIEITPKARQTYKSHLKNHVYPYLGRERIAEISREQLCTHLMVTLHGRRFAQVQARDPVRALPARPGGRDHWRRHRSLVSGRGLSTGR
jgi:hypothetical protein